MFIPLSTIVDHGLQLIPYLFEFRICVSFLVALTDVPLVGVVISFLCVGVFGIIGVFGVIGVLGIICELTGEELVFDEK